MKRYILALTMLIAVLAVKPIESVAQFRYGPMVGLTLSNLKWKQDLITVDQAAGFSAGIGTELMFPGIGFGISSGLLYEMRGATLHLGEKEIWASQGYANPRSYLHYIELPINLRFKWTRMNGLEDYWAPYVFGGPVFSIMVAHNDIKALTYSHGSVGMCAGIGFEIFRRWHIQGSYNWGLTYAVKTRLLDNFSAQDRTFNIRVAYMF